MNLHVKLKIRFADVKESITNPIIYLVMILHQWDNEWPGQGQVKFVFFFEKKIETFWMGTILYS